MELCDESIEALYNYWINERNIARDCRWTQTRLIKEKKFQELNLNERYERYDKRYKECDTQVRMIRKFKS